MAYQIEVYDQSVGGRPGFLVVVSEDNAIIAQANAETRNYAMYRAYTNARVALQQEPDADPNRDALALLAALDGVTDYDTDYGTARMDAIAAGLRDRRTLAVA